jgi:DNA-binding response OmpR family regulator
MYAQAASRHGLGLSIAQGLAKALGGKIEVKSTEGAFAEFTVALPAMGTGEDAGANGTPTPDGVGEGARLATFGNEKPVVFVVDDHRDIVWLIREELGEEFHVVGCHSAQEALEETRRITPDLIITDIVMPGMDGLELIREVSGNRYTSRVPIIVVSAKITDRERAVGLDQGADAYLTKPFSMVVLRSTVKRLLAERSSLKEYYSRPESAFVMANGQAIHQKDRAFMESVTGVITAHLGRSELKPEFIADQLSMPSRSLCSKVKEVSGYTPSELIKHYRFSTAGRLLLTTRMTVQEVMYEVGISSKSYFNREFLRAFGMNPKEYRSRP